MKPSQAILSMKSILKGSNTPYLQGKPGIGKSAIVRKLAEEFAEGREIVNSINPTKKQFGFIDFRLSLYETVDLIWKTAGDTSVDFNFYTKRILLTAVLTSTTTCWLADKSEGHKDTWDFLDRRIEDVMKIPKLNALFQSKVEKCFGSIRGRFS